MKKLLGILVLGLLFCSTGNAAKYGKGELKLSRSTVDYFIQYVRGKGTKYPADFYVAIDGNGAVYWTCKGPSTCLEGDIAQDILHCERVTGKECKKFARKRTIKWKNGINKATKINSKWSDDQIKAKLTELGFIGESTSNSTQTTSTKKIEKKKESKQANNTEIVFNKCKLFESATEFYNTYKINLKKNIVYNEFFAEGEIYNSTLKIIKNDDAQVVTKIEAWGTKKKQFHQYVFDKKTNNAYEILFKDKKGKIEDEKIKLYCDDVVGKWKNQKTKITKKKSKKTDDSNDIVKQIKELKELYDSGVLTKEEFEKSKKKLLN